MATTTSIAVVATPLVLQLLYRADDALILGHRLSEWTGHAPTLEEELALANIALDLIGQARALYDYAGTLTGHSEDQLAYLRDAAAWRNCLMVELPNGDFAFSIARLLLVSAFADPFWRAAMASTDGTIAAVAAKAEKETAYHLRHAAEWLIRLGDGTAESHRRAQTALDDLWPYTGELFTSLPGEADIAPDPNVTARHLECHRQRHPCARHAGAAIRRVDAVRWARRTPYRTPRPPAGRDAVPPTHLSGRHMVAAASLRERALAALETVCDPEIPVLTIADLGILRDVSVHDETVEVTITPTYSGCPAMNMITLEIETALARAGIEAHIRTSLSPAWTTDWLTDAARRKLAAFGIAPPEHTASRRALFGEAHPACPLCGSADTEQISEFGSTACKSLHRCRACREPFDAFKCH